MKIKVVKNDITKVKDVDAVVNTANPFPIIGSGTDSAIYKAAGEEKLLEYRVKKIGNIEPGDARISPGFDLESKFIIHTVGPVYIDGNHNEEKILRNCYRNTLELAKENNCKSIVFPLISTGTYGFPKEDAISIALSEINDFIIKNVTDIEITIAVLGDTSYFLLSKIIDNAEINITPEEIRKKYEEEYGPYHSLYKKIRSRENRSKTKTTEENEYFVLSDDDKSFFEMIRYYLNIRKEKPKTVYDRVDMDKRQFSKIINDDRSPSRNDAVKLCMGLRLTLKESVDLLSRAGYNFNPSNPVDRIITKGIREGKSYEEIKNNIKNQGLRSYLT